MICFCVLWLSEECDVGRVLREGHRENERAPVSFWPGNLSEICARNWARRGEGPGLVSSGVPPGVQMPPLSFSY